MPGAVMISAMFRAALNGQAQGPNLPHSAASLPAWAAMSRSRNGGPQVLRRRVSPSYARRNSVGKRLPRHGTAGALGERHFLGRDGKRLPAGQAPASAITARPRPGAT